MTSTLVFNHHSLPFDSPENAEKGIEVFLRISVSAQNNGLSTILVAENVDTSWYNIELSNKYYFRDWLNKNKHTNKNLITVFMSIATKRPFFSQIDIDNNVNLFEVSFNNEIKYEALRAAAWHESPLISFSSDMIWQKSFLNIYIRTLDNNSNIHEKPFELTNFYSYQNFEKELPAIRKKQQDRIKSARDILANISKLYSGIELCGKSEQQLYGWSADLNIIQQIKESFAALSLFAQKWQENLYQDYKSDYLVDSGLNHRVSGESESIANNPSVRKKREFYLPNGSKVFFSEHIKISKGYRIYFYPDCKSKRVYIGYIGSHL